MASTPLLFTPISLRGVTLKNRVVISPMCQYSASDGLANDWHFAHLAKFAIGGAGLVFAEAAAVEANGRMRFTLELAEILRAAWPQDKPLFVRVSSVDGIKNGWTLDDTVALAKELKARGVDVLDCSSGGLMGSATAARVKRSPGFQVPFAERVRKEAGMPTMAVGLILDSHQAEQVLQSGQADLIAVGRQALYNPNWALHGEVALGVVGEYKSWPVQYGWWLDKRQHILSPEAKAKAAA